jgi:hypothetical protein
VVGQGTLLVSVVAVEKNPPVPPVFPCLHQAGSTLLSLFFCH